MAQYLQFRYLKLQLTLQLDNCTTCFTQSLSIGVSPASLDQFWNSQKACKFSLDQPENWWSHAMNGPHSWWVISVKSVKHPLDLPISRGDLWQKRRQPEPSWPHRSSKPGHFTGSLGRIGAMFTFWDLRSGLQDVLGSAVPVISGDITYDNLSGCITLKVYVYIFMWVISQLMGLITMGIWVSHLYPHCEVSLVVRHSRYGMIFQKPTILVDQWDTNFFRENVLAHWSGQKQ